MRWLSLDQKPSWFNNAGLTGTWARKGQRVTIREKFAATRERYTILTAVPWPRLSANPADPPKIEVLFKAKPGGLVIKRLRRDVELPSWMRVQVQDYGSYRSEDVVAALEWMLPDATRPEESIILLLDWYSGHRTEEVKAVVSRKGHILLFHGGGTTPFTQVNDTHLHAWLQRLLIQVENEWAVKERKTARSQGLSLPTPKPTRETILEQV